MKKFSNTAGKAPGLRHISVTQCEEFTDRRGGHTRGWGRGTTGRPGLILCINMPLAAAVSLGSRPAVLLNGRDWTRDGRCPQPEPSPATTVRFQRRDDGCHQAEPTSTGVSSFHGRFFPAVKSRRHRVWLLTSSYCLTGRGGLDWGRIGPECPLSVALVPCLGSGRGVT